MPFKKKKLTGFTLLELILVMGIIAILSVALTAAYQSFQRGAILDIASREIVGKLREAQARALSGEDGSRWGVRFDNSLAGYRLFSTLTTFASGAVKETLFLSNRVEYKTFDGGGLGSPLDITFERLTGVPSGSVSHSLEINIKSSPTFSKLITVTTSGRISD
ncbi:MAG: prepilin-type N-terminal cleavage/methylation domain-containing protein [Parcubacteria group bacterium]|nr:prepilin-type N-terminal cleavage/methylation domain-containing protein [Parcubacteria group bacterium]